MANRRRFRSRALRSFRDSAIFHHRSEVTTWSYRSSSALGRRMRRNPVGLPQLPAFTSLLQPDTNAPAPPAANQPPPATAAPSLYFAIAAGHERAGAPAANQPPPATAAPSLYFAIAAGHERAGAPAANQPPPATAAPSLYFAIAAGHERAGAPAANQPPGATAAPSVYFAISPSAPPPGPPEREARRGRRPQTNLSVTSEAATASGWLVRRRRRGAVCDVIFRFDGSTGLTRLRSRAR